MSNTTTINRCTKSLTAAIICIFTTLLLMSCKPQTDTVDYGTFGVLDDIGEIGWSASPVLISEVHSTNADYKDQFGKDPGWVEFYNPTDTAINLSGYRLSDNAEKTGWEFGNVTIAARGYVTVFLSRRDIPDYDPPNSAHSPLSLKKSKGGKLFLTDIHGRIIDSVAYPPGILGLSYARDFKIGAWSYTRPPTPNGANSKETYVDGRVPPPTEASFPNSGHYDKHFSFSIPDGENGAVIACDMTGALPTLGSKFKSGSTVNLKKTTVMRCAAFKEGAYPSEPIMRTYIIGRLPDLPIVSIAVNPRDMFDKTHGIYSMGPNAGKHPYKGANFQGDKEIPVQIDFFEKGMMSAWTHRAGLKIFGGQSRSYPKKSVAITFRERYGTNRLVYQLFPEHPELRSFKHFLLRNNGSNAETDYIRDMLMTSLTEGLGIDYQRGRAAVVYYNGEYFGIHNIRERANADYFETKYGITENDLDFVERWDVVSVGSDSDYQNVIKWLESLNGLNEDDFKNLETRIDVDNFTYHWMCRMYYHDRDWPENNVKRWRTHSSKWKYLMYDTDYGWGSLGQYNQPNVNTMDFVTATDGPKWPNPPNVTFLFRKLLENDNYKQSFINRFSLLMATYFASDRVNARIDALMTPIENEIPHDQKKWNRELLKLEMWSAERWLNRLKDLIKGRDLKTQMKVIRNFNDNRRPQMQQEIESHFGLSDGIDFTLSVNGNGKIHVHNMEVLNDSATFKVYPSVPIVLKAVSTEDAVFETWSDGVTDAERIVTITKDQPVTLQAIFKRGVE